MREVKMTFELGQLSFPPAVAAPSQAPARPAGAAAEPAATAAPVHDVDVSDLIPASPPPEVLAEVDAAWERAAELAAQNRELHFRRDDASGRMVIEVRTLDGEVLRIIPPSKMLDVLSGGEL
jgi:FlaG protein